MKSVLLKSKKNIFATSFILGVALTFNTIAVLAEQGVNSTPKGKVLCALSGSNPKRRNSALTARSSCSQIQETIRKNLPRKNSQTVSDYLVNRFFGKKLECLTEIDPEGNISSIKTINSETNPEMQASAINLVKDSQPFTDCLAGHYLIKFPSLKVLPYKE